MTFKSFFIAAFVQWLLMAFLKVWFFNHQIFSDPGVQEVAFWLISAVIYAAIVRRMGIMNFFEAIFIAIAWVLGNLLLDLMLVSAYTGLQIFHSHQYWGGYVVMAAAIMLFHKKRHIQVRHELHERDRAKH